MWSDPSLVSMALVNLVAIVEIVSVNGFQTFVVKTVVLIILMADVVATKQVAIVRIRYST